MSLQEFTIKMATLYEGMDPSALQPSTAFRELDEWSSLVALFVVAMVDADYGVSLRGDELKRVNTVEELYELVCRKYYVAFMEGDVG